METIVSVVMATYRREKELKLALKSLQKQSYTLIEVVLVDDNDDMEWNNKVQEITDYFNYHSSLKILLLKNHPSMGAARSRNKGIEASSGKYITFLDDDDIYLPDKIRYQYNRMKKTNADYCISNLSLYSEKGRLIEVRNRPYLLTSEADNLFLCHLKYHMTGTDSMMFKRDYLIEIGMFEPIDLGDEYYLMMKAIRRNGKFTYLNRNDIKAVVHVKKSGLSSGQKKIQGENALFNYKKKFFHFIEKREKRFIIMRHHAVLAFAYLRMNKIFLFIIESVKAFLKAPVRFLDMLIHLK